MKKLLAVLFLSLTMMFNTSCATILGGKVTEQQRTKPAEGEPARKVRVGALVANILLTGAIGLIVDFSTKAIYKPE